MKAAAATAIGVAVAAIYVENKHDKKNIFIESVRVAAHKRGDRKQKIQIIITIRMWTIFIELVEECEKHVCHRINRLGGPARRNTKSFYDFKNIVRRLIKLKRFVSVVRQKPRSEAESRK